MFELALPLDLLYFFIPLDTGYLIPCFATALYPDITCYSGYSN